MDIILQELKIRISLNEEIYKLFLSILQTENNQIIFQNFEKLLLLKDTFKLNSSNEPETNNDDKNRITKEYFNYYIALLTLYSFNLHKDFKNPLITTIKASKNIPFFSLDFDFTKSIFDKILEDYFEIIDLSKESNNIEYMRAKLLCFISYFDLLKNLNYVESEKIKFHYYKGFKSLLKEMENHLKKVNDDIFQLLIMFFKFLNLFYKQNPFYNIDQELIDLLYNHLFLHYENLKQVQFCKDYEFNLANCYFQISYMKIKKNSKEPNSFKQIQEYIKLGKALFSKFSSDSFKSLLYFKAFILNVDRDAYLFECLNSDSKEKLYTETNEEHDSNFEFLSFIQENYFIKNSEKKAFDEVDQSTSNNINFKVNFLDFYNAFLTNDLKLNLTSLINEIFLSIIIKSNVKTLSNTENKVDDIKNLVFNFLLKENILDKIFMKMEKDKNYFSIMDDFYYFIVEAIYLNESFKESIENLCFKYLKNIIDKNYKLMVIEVKLFKFLNFQKDENVILVKEFFKFIFGKKFDKKNLPLINEYIKIMCEFFFKNSELLENQRGLNSKNQNKQIEISNLISEYKNLDAKYKKFLDVFCEPFFEYIRKVEGKSLKHFKNIFGNLEKFNKNLYVLIVNEFHKKYFQNNNLPQNIDFENLSKNYLIFITLIKPFKNYKKSFKIVEEEDFTKIKFTFEIFKNYKEVNFCLFLKDIENLMKSLDRYLVIYTLEFLIGMECEENVFEIIYSLIKYNLKTSYVEFKASIMKTLNVYFIGYIEKINRLLSLKDKTKVNKEHKSKNVTQIYKPEEKIFLEKSKLNFIKLLRFLSENIYDRSVENLLCYLEILKLIITNFDHKLPIFENNPQVININEENNMSYILAFNKIFRDFIFNKGLAFSLISLLRQSWSLVRATSYSILKNQNFNFIISAEKEILTQEIIRSVNSLRQMDAEGCVNLFLLLIHQIKNEYFDFFMQALSQKNKITFNCENNVINNNEKQNSFGILNNILLKFMFIINSKRECYFNFINSKQEHLNSNCEMIDSDFYIHSYFIFISNTLQELKDSPNFLTDKEDIYKNRIYDFVILINNLSDIILNLNAEFRLFLINNGVAEFNMSNEGDNEGFESEDKRLISLWISTKYSLQSLNLCFEIINNYYKILPKDEKFEIILHNIQRNIEEIIDLMIDYKHMGAICGLNDALLSACRIVIFSFRNKL